jgi:cytochrome oxidase Cu insertion factor (SCO1/SenC/PrrC family)
MRLIHRILRTYLTFQLCLIGLAAAQYPMPAAAATARLDELPATWRDDRGQPFDLRSLQGQIVVLTMAYASCHRVCPLTMDRLRKLQRDFDERGTRAAFVIVGYDPEADDPAAWRQYRQTRHLTRENWHFLVGSRAAVVQTARQLGFEFWQYDQHVMHDSRIIYFNEQGVLGEPVPGGFRQPGDLSFPMRQ